MDRNFFRRVEVCFPIREPALKARNNADLALYLDDNQQAWRLLTNGSYERVQAQPDDEPVSAQTQLLLSSGAQL